ncbi:MAG: glycerophosphodiester phosphodiesterase [Promethearchaeota archaeon]|jgi:glycerophosphoryl diester phosphodiesterase
MNGNANTVKKILIFGHRGASNIAPENTLKAFNKAIELKADYIEFDVHQSKDGEIVIMHDGNTLRTTGHFGLIKNMTLSELKELDCGEGETILTLQELIKIAKGRIGFNCEIKDRGFAEKIIKILNEADIIEKTIVSSFKHDILLKIRELDSRIKLASLEPTRTGWILSWFLRKKMIDFAVKNKFYAIHPFYKLVNFKLVQKAQKNNIKVFPWTVNSDSAIKRLIQLGVDGIITNEISKAQEILNQMS